MVRKISRSCRQLTFATGVIVTLMVYSMMMFMGRNSGTSVQLYQLALIDSYQSNLLKSGPRRSIISSDSIQPQPENLNKKRFFDRFDSSEIVYYQLNGSDSKGTTERPATNSRKMSNKHSKNVNKTSKPAEIKTVKIHPSTLGHRTASIKNYVEKTNDTVMYKQYMTNLTDRSYYDPYTKVVMGTPGSCHNVSSYDAVMAVHTAPGNLANRQAFRWLYSDLNKTHPYKIKLLFFIGLVRNATLQSALATESETHRDVIQGNFVDSYRNLTYKAVFAYKWLSDHCGGIRLLIRLDDDVFVAVRKFFRVLGPKVAASQSTAFCDVRVNDAVKRDGKWAVKRSEIPEDVYHFQHCLGYFAVLTPDLVRKMDEAARRTKFFWIDDVFAYGFTANKIGVRFVNVYWNSARTRQERFQNCLEALGEKCDFFVVIAKPEKFPVYFSLLQNNIINSNSTVASR